MFYGFSFAITDSYPTQAGRQSKRFRCQQLQAFCRKQFSYHKNVLGPLPEKPCLPLRNSPFPGLDSLLPSLLRYRYPFKFPSPCSSHRVMQRFGGEKQQRVQAGISSNSVNFHHRTLALWRGSLCNVETVWFFSLFPLISF